VVSVALEALENKMSIQADCVLGLQFGDEGKGKVVSHLISKNKYDYCMRFNGGHNAGHTIIHNGKKIVTHIIPSGIVHNILCIIGHGCVINPVKFFEEVRYLEENGYHDCRKYIKIAYNAHIITPEHIAEDNKDTKIGTTKQGNGPCYRDKHSRIGIRAESVPELKPFLIDVYEELYNKKVKVLLEGAQAIGLDINWGPFYPCLTSSTCGIGGAIDAGIPPKSIRNVLGVCKAYVTYVGAKEFQPDYVVLNEIQEVGKEYGATTGRKRQCDFVDLDLLNKAIDINGVNVLIINKMDILNEVGDWRYYKKDEYSRKINCCDGEKEFKKHLKKNIRKGVKIIFSYSPEKI